jgi:hypothetical protein
VVPPSPNRLRTHAVLATALLALVTFGCRAFSGTGPDAGVVDPTVEAAKLVPFLPATLGAFTATGAPTTMGSLPGPIISARRSYKSTDGRSAELRLSTGDVHGDVATLESDDEHAFGSDSPTYWRTTSVAGHRTRVAEERPKTIKSECVVRVGKNHVADVTITPALPGDCETVASLLDFAGITATGGVPSPPVGRR